MGYYTDHTLEMKNVTTQETFNQITEWLAERGLTGYAFEDSGTYNQDTCYGCFYPYGECKWSQHDCDMRDLAAAFPTVVFKLHGDGEDFDDVWDEYYLDGKEEHLDWIIKPRTPTKIAWY